ncbi:N-acetylmuramoyl-L-alanine amidase [Synechococcus sp. BSF8S]|uniref:peptidoglycan recognition protein family protein n=1 Tax=Synechococcales TaxID=1890424 RepID=UPI001626AC2B|nr:MULTISPECIES: N-acetylmuramoyl-L-alanine amidase [unclassified Synechococcus]MBC1262362.1 N-acetylmuramoyl-L-alanine amidase [Synechococcus sp. BSF8S]MBC1265265.1 N-acetylmuramoyl-L-alanine amidase [Synechococcus sp. BSA11S]
MPFTAKVISAAEWGASSPLNAPFDRTIPKYVVIHHTFKPRNASQGTLDGAKKAARQIQAFHMGPQRGWSDSGHNFLNTKGGFLLEGRHGSLEAAISGFCVQSAHARQDQGKLAGGNSSPGIENEGDFDQEQMEQDQWDSLVELSASLCSSCNIAPSNIRGHRDFSVTQCPGNWLYDRLDQLRSEVRSKLGLPAVVGTEEGEKVLPFGLRGPAVLVLQKRLSELGFNPGPIDGIFGDDTRSAVVAFQNSRQLLPDGVVGPITRNALNL